MQIDIEKYLSRFKVFPNQHDLSKEDLIKWLPNFRCPVCHRRLKWSLDGRKAFCKSQRKDRYFITEKALSKFVELI